MPNMTPADLLHADILLYHGEHFISRAIRFFDNSHYNHASIYMDDGNVMEALARGVVRQTIPETLSRPKQVTVVRLTSRPADVKPVLNAAIPYEGDRYGFEQILLLVLICTFRRIRRNNAVARFLRRLLEGAAGFLLTLTGGNRKALICSELVFRAYNEAVPGDNDPYTIRIDRRPSIATFSPMTVDALDTDNMISFFYGPGSARASRHAETAPIVLKENVQAKLNASREVTIQDFESGDLEKLFNDVVVSYQKEDYNLDGNEAAELKKSLDFFVAASMGAAPSSTLRIESDIVDLFIKENANFVTPGDFARTSSVVAVGDIK